MELATTIVIVSDGVSVVVPARIALAPSVASVACPAPGPPVALSARMPPMDVLTTNRPMVTTNQPMKTGQRCRALQLATRTVQGWRGRPLGGGSCCMGETLRRGGPAGRCSRLPAGERKGTPRRRNPGDRPPDSGSERYGRSQAAETAAATRSISASRWAAQSRAVPRQPSPSRNDCR